jgi:TM2 domain-containing membrane protein YozV
MTAAPTASYPDSPFDWHPSDEVGFEYDGTHTIFFGYLFWLIGFTGAHRFYYGRVGTGILWFFTLGLFGVGWVIDFFLIPEMDRAAERQFAPGPTDYNIAWLLLVFAGPLGFHRFVQHKWFTGALYLCTLGLFGLGVVYDVLTLNDQIDEDHRRWALRGGE